MKYLKRTLAFLLVAVIAVSVIVFPANAASYPKAKINTAGVNIRSGAGLTCNVIANYPVNTSVSLLSPALYNSDWYHIMLPDSTRGYIHKDYLTINKNQLYIPEKATGYKGYFKKYSALLNTTGYDVAWTSSDSSVASVDYAGKITCKKVGSVTITAKAGTKTVKSTLNVVNATVSFPDSSLATTLGETLKLNASCAKPLTYTCSDESVATVSESGILTPKKLGTVKVTAKSTSGKATCTVQILKYNITLKTNKKVLYSDGYALLKASGGSEGYTFKSSDKKVVVVSKTGIVHAVGTGTASVTCKSGTLSKSINFTVKSGSYLGLTTTKLYLKKDMTYYMKASNAYASWKSSDTSVATVKNGYITGIKKGAAIITASTSDGERDCIVRITAADPVRFVYTSENSALPNKAVRFYAITDTSRVNVRFKITDPEGKASWLSNPKSSKSDGRLIWSKAKTLSTPGEYSIAAYSKTSEDGDWETGPGGKATTFVNESTSRRTVDFAEKRATTKTIKNIASYEGFLPTVTADPLVTDAPTVGYGRVVFAGDEFYNGMTTDEAYAYLVNTVNSGGYTTNLNRTLLKYKIKFNQSHFDALLDFSYNLGAYAISNYSDLLGVLTNSYGKASYAKKAFVNTTSVGLWSKPEADSKLLKALSPYEIVTLNNTKLYNEKWYYVKTKEGTKGYVRSAYLTRRSNDTKVRNLKNVTLTDFRNKFMAYHHASGNCYWGLLYRRLDEVEMFFFNDYDLNGRSNTYRISYTCPQNSNTYI